MVLLGTLVNGLLIIIGALIGKVLNRIPDKMKATVMNGIAVAVIVLGVQMGFKSENFLIVILSIVIGAVVGEAIALDDKLRSVGSWLEKRLGGKGKDSISQGFITGTLIFVIGAMSVVGALDSGIRGDHSVLYTKSIIDGFTALILTSSLGIGVIFSAVPVVLYEGLIALFATQIDRIVPVELMDMFIKEMTSTGGVMILAIGLNILGLTKIRVANFLPGIVVVAAIVSMIYGYQVYFS